MLVQEKSLAEVLEIENHPGILEFRCADTDLLLWPLIRNVFIRMIMSDLVYATPLIDTAESKPFSKVSKALIRASWHNSQLRNDLRADIAIFASGLGNYELNGKFFNRLSDYFAGQFKEQTLVIEDLFQWALPKPRHNNRVYYHTPLQVRLALDGRIRRTQRHRTLATHLVNYLKEQAYRHLQWQLRADEEAYLVNLATRLIAAIPVKVRAYQNLLQRLDARVVMKEEGCYGSSAVLNFAAKQLGITVAEFQHGSVSAGHDVYNFSRLLTASRDMQKLLPDIFLGYGTWWNQQINAPLHKLVIGNPHRSQQISGLVANTENRDEVLVLGDGLETDKYLSFVRDLAQKLRNRRRVVFRPHPLERFKFTANMSYQDFSIDLNPNIYQSFASADTIVSEVSTGLFESIGLVKRAFVWDTPKSRFAYPTHPLGRFSDAQDLSDKIHGSNEGLMDPEKAEAFWASDWQKNYHDFLETIGARP